MSLSFMNIRRKPTLQNAAFFLQSRPSCKLESVCFDCLERLRADGRIGADEEVIVVCFFHFLLAFAPLTGTL